MSFLSLGVSEPLGRVVRGEADILGISGGEQLVGQFSWDRVE